ncbi:ANTAR domain-containing protein [Promicromonospora sp. Populi]|uniref:ANTAR domain-containing protein n=1 Tax=Promicromonospora sp. Populi TaxID=3239420 RepID=UPI0034E236A9
MTLTHPDPGTEADAGRSVPAPLVGDNLGRNQGQSERTVSPVLVGETMIERAKSVIVVARRVDDDQAAQVLLDAACEAHIPVRVMADQVMAALRFDANLQTHAVEDVVQDTLAHALGTIRPVDRQEPPSATLPGDQVA